MKIAIIGTFLGQKSSGAEISSFHLAKNLQKAGHNVFAITTKKTQKIPFTCYTIRATRYVPNNILLIGSKILDYLMKRKIRTVLKKEKPDIVHIQDPSIMIASLQAAKSLRLKTIMTVREYRFATNLSIPLEEGKIPLIYNKKEYKKWLYKSFEQAYGKGYLSYIFISWFYSQNNRVRSWFRRFDHYITVSDFVNMQLQRAGVSPSKVTTIKVSKEDWQVKSLPKNKQPIIFSAGGLKRSKGFGKLLHAFSRVVQEYPLAKLIIAGDGSDKQRLEGIRRKLRLEQNVVFLGSISHEYMKKQYAKADFIISPSLWPEPLSRVIFESFSMQRTIIATNVGGSSELVRNNKTGVLVEPHDIAQMANAMIMLIEKPKLREKMAMNGYKLITKECSAAMNAKNHINVYLALINAKKKRRKT